MQESLTILDDYMEEPWTALTDRPMFFRKHLCDNTFPSGCDGN